MSIGACYYSIDSQRVASLLGEPDSLVEQLSASEDKGGPASELTVEQAWDVVKSLLPESIGDDFIDAPDAGEMGVFHMPATEVSSASMRLNSKNLEELVADFSALAGEHAELYWADYWAENSDDLLEVLRDVVLFFAKAAERGDAVLFCIG
jgi:hypothetical protein